MIDRAFLVHEGFVGFQSIRELRQSKLADVPNSPGVYVILRAEGPTQQTFRNRSNGGHFKGQDPSVSIEELRANWIDGAVVLYIGKAGGTGQQATLRSRIAKLLEFGSGKPAAHWGGRYIWQMHGSDNLIVCWRVLEVEDPRDFEKQLLNRFKSHYGRLPFANLRM